DTFQLIGPNGPVSPLNIEFRRRGASVQLTYPLLAVGNYQMQLQAAKITDLAGNALGTTTVTNSFQVAPYSKVWMNPSGGFWDVPGNWDNGTVPGPTDTVLIDRPGNVPITFRTGTTLIRSLMSNNPFTLSGGILTVSQTVQVNNVFTMT